MPQRKAILSVFSIWLLLACAAGLSGIYRRMPPIAIPITIWMLVGILLAGYLLLPAFREWVRNEDVETFVLFHLTRFVGIWFLVLYQAGCLPYDFAVPGGWGDIVAGVGAIVVIIISLVKPGRVAWWSLLFWNIYGTVDILFVVATAARLGISDPASMAALREFPLNLLPLFVVPLIIASHLFIFIRLKRAWI